MSTELALHPAPSVYVCCPEPSYKDGCCQGCGCPENPLQNMEIYDRILAWQCPDCGSEDIRSDRFWVEAKHPWPAMWIDDNCYHCENCGFSWSEDGDP